MSHADGDDFLRRLAALNNPQDINEGNVRRRLNNLDGKQPEWSEREAAERLAKLEGEGPPNPDLNVNLDNLTEEERLMCMIQDDVALSQGRKPGQYTIPNDDDDDFGMDDLDDFLDEITKSNNVNKDNMELNSMKNETDNLLQQYQNMMNNDSSQKK